MEKISPQNAVSQSDKSAKPAEATLSNLRQDANLWYRIRVLLHDLSNIGGDPSAERRLSSTTHKLYISAPYFTESEAIKVRTTVLDNPTEATTAEDRSNGSSKNPSPPSYDKATLEEAIHNRLANFFDKRRASGDSRPCGPHDMFPIYVSAFGIGKEELKDKRFLSRLRRSGLGDSKSQQDNAASCQGEGLVKGLKKD